MYITFSPQNDDFKALSYAAAVPSFPFYFNLLDVCFALCLHNCLSLCQVSTISQKGEYCIN